MTPTVSTYGRMDEVARGVGYFGVVELGDSLTIDGWILATPLAPVDSFALLVDGEQVATAAADPRPDMVLPDFVPEGAATWFSFAEVRPPFAVRDLTSVSVVACASGQPVSRLVTLVRRGLDALPTPPEHLMVRVTGSRDGEMVKRAGLRCAGELLETLTRHRPLPTVRRVLDWGCGCARVTLPLIDALAPFPAIVVEGCDLDAEAVRWANENVREGAFTVVGAHPPLPWPDATFDVVVACSVFTHLTRGAQTAWLEEMQRVLAPGGMLLASIFSNDADFSDETRDAAFDGIAPDDYYRFTAQSRAYVVAEWSRWFDIAEFVESGLESAQHLVVMRRRAIDGPVASAAPVSEPRPEEPFVTPQLQAAPAAGAFPPGHFYSPIPAWDEVARDAGRIFATPAAIPGIDLRAGAQLSLLHRLAEHYPDLPYDTREGLRYRFDNPNFGHGDAVVLYAMIRHLRPRRIVEVGSGYSSCVMLDTNEVFFDGSIDCTFIDPAPQLLESLLHPGDRVRILAQRVQDAPEEAFEALEANDILFIDSSHVLKTGSDVNHLLFEVLPRLPSGVYVHFHDVFHPFEYPQQWLLELGLAWNEIYAIRAFLQFNSAFEVAFFNHYMATVHAEAFRAAMPLVFVNPGGSLWIRKC